jgi:hypothetical protein
LAVEEIYCFSIEVQQRLCQLGCLAAIDIHIFFDEVCGEYLSRLGYAPVRNRARQIVSQCLVELAACLDLLQEYCDRVVLRVVVGGDGWGLHNNRSTDVGKSIDSAQLIGGYNHFCTELKMSQLVYGCTGRTPTTAGKWREGAVVAGTYLVKAAFVVALLAYVAVAFSQVENTCNSLDTSGKHSRQAGLFGSFVRNQGKEGSDIDLLVDIVKEKKTF